MSEQSLSVLMGVRGELAAAAQAVYDEWTQDAEGNDEEYGAGGICHDIADAMVGVLDRHGIDSQSVSQSIGDVHVYVIAKVKEGVYSVDIPPSTYERGSAYTWTKIDGVKFDANDIDISRIDANPDRFEDYIEGRHEGFKGWMRWSEAGGPLMIRRGWPDLIALGTEEPTSPTSRKIRQGRRRLK